ncbi:flagellar hook-length control protein FliK [Photorhabdus heterorhabditis]|uniref:Flagellar hook-length control protein FliK n=1 Tax=Photorhabdus heterorhabditis TaxID=880156 RepID=A0A5B0WRU3_9GAMM|nr:flagellar hook-length control protein FliK [Photorhabdus heterorhabditis]KAA1189055.1 flagellar hook-length control protein FliK [Photorhabdus heterorhabditis]KOY62341.1 flagellar hook-length control protein FliK [Photorhabdus heterorhabditis]
MNITLLPADLKSAENPQMYSDSLTDSEQPSAFAQLLNLETEPAQKGMIKPGKISSKEGKEITDDTNNDLSPLLSISPEIPTESINSSLIPLDVKVEVNKQPVLVDEKLMSAEALAASLPVQLSGLAISSENQKSSLLQPDGLIKHNDKNRQITAKELVVTGLSTEENPLTTIPEQLKQEEEKAEVLFKIKPENGLVQHSPVKSKLAPATIQHGIQPESTTQNHPRESVLIQTTTQAEIQPAPTATENQQTGQISAVTTSPLLSAGHNQTTQFQLSSASTPLLNAQLGSEEWQQQLNQQIMLFNRNGLQQAELRLHPQELGALQIRMSVEDNQAQLHLASAHSHVRAALEAALPSLRHALAESGIQLTQSSISSDSSSPWQQEQRSGSQNSGNGRDHNANTSPETLVATESTINLTPHQLASVRGGVDIFA